MRGLICDDHPMMRQALAGTLARRWPGLQLNEAGDWPTAWALAEAEPDFCLVDLGMPGAAPEPGLAHLRARAPAATLIVITGLGDAGLIARIRGSGLAAAILSKNAEPDALIGAILASLPGLAVAASPSIGGRQREVLELIALGLTNKEIAHRLGIAPATVKIHVSRLIAALGVSNRTEAAALARARDFG